jgi:hypothetical protein
MENLGQDVSQRGGEFKAGAGGAGGTAWDFPLRL